MKNLAFFFCCVFAFLLGALCVVVFWLPAQTVLSPTKKQNVTQSTSSFDDYLESSIPLEEPQQVIIPQKNEVNEIVNALKTSFIDQNPMVQKLSTTSSPEEVDFVLQRNQPLFFLTNQSANQLPSAPLFAWIDNQFGYVRLTNLSPDTVDSVIEKWTEWQPTLKGLIIDLRYTRLDPYFDQLSRIASFFVTPNTPLFSLQSTKTQQKVFYSPESHSKMDSKIPLLILVGSHTQGNAEVLAHILQTQGKAVLIGQKTSGRTALYTETKLSSGRYLYLASTQAISANGQKLISVSLQPDVLTAVKPSEDYTSWKRAYDQNLSIVLAQPPLRKKQNERSLQDQKNPEWENKSKQQNVFDLKSQDIILQRAVQTIRSLNNPII
jgi:C-terminal processing protease CtpA/Prc